MQLLFVTLTTQSASETTVSVALVSSAVQRSFCNAPPNLSDQDRLLSLKVLVRTSIGHALTHILEEDIKN